MGLSSEDIKNKLALRLDMYGLATQDTDKLLNLYIDTAVMEIAAEKWYRDLLKTEYLKSDSEGKITVQDKILPYALFGYGTEGTSHSWQRFTPIDYEYFLNWDSRAYTKDSYGGVNRYSIIPSSNVDYTVLQLLEEQSSIDIKLVYYPIRPAVADFPPYFEPYLTNKVLYLYMIDKGDAVKDRSIKMVMDQDKTLQKNLKKQAQSIEINKTARTARNRKTKSWLTSENDIGHWIRY